MDYSTLLLPLQISYYVVVLFGVVFSVFMYFRRPQENLDRKQAMDQLESDGKASMIQQQMQWEKDSTEKRFAEMGSRMTESMTLAQNHIHTVDTKVDGLIGTVTTMGNEITRLSTIIEERIPKQ